jgi:hypothetical protein
LSAGHARALLSLDSSGEQLATARYIHSKVSGPPDRSADQPKAAEEAQPAARAFRGSD